MNLTRLPNPPDPQTYGGNQSAWMRDAYQWMVNTKAQIETDSTINTAPVAPFWVGTYTAVSTVTGTDNLSNFVATLVAGMLKTGIVSNKKIG